MILHLATLDTRNYRFQALGLTEDEARAALEQAWTVHAEQAGADDWSEFSGDVSVEALGMPAAIVRRIAPGA